MAVKQHNIETDEEEDNVYNRQSSNKKYPINQVIDYIDGLADIDELPKTEYFTVCEKLVQFLAFIEIPSDKASVNISKEQIAKIDVFFEKLMDFDESNQMTLMCINAFHCHMKLDRPSPATGLILHRLEKCSMLKELMSDIFNDSDFVKTVKNLCKWLVHSFYLKNLDQWIINILLFLQSQQKYELLLTISLNNIDEIIKIIRFPFFRMQSVNLLLQILTICATSPKNLQTPLIFDKFFKNFQQNFKCIKATDPDTVYVSKFVNIIKDLKKVYPEYGQNDDSIVNRSFFHELTVEYNNSNSTPWYNRAKHTATFSQSYQRSNDRVGLVNLGNTCYMNSVLQALVMTKQFSREILLLQDIRTPIFQNLQKLFALLLHSKRPSFSPNVMLQTARPPTFDPGHQQDSSEFLGYLMDALHDQEKSLNLSMLQQQQQLQHDYDEDVVMKNNDDDGACALITNINDKNTNKLTNKSIIQRSFEGSILITYKCLKCDTKSKHIDSFRDLQLSFPDTWNSETTASVQTLLEYYCSTEKLVADNKYYCEQCKMLCDAERFITVLTPPRNLILTLKHFKYDQKYNLRTKLMHNVHHDEIVRLRIVPESESDRLEEFVVKYHLYAAIVHSGTNMDSGHYYTYGSDQTSSWYEFNDNFVTKCNVSDLHSLQPPQTPYILFYQMIDMKPSTLADGSPVATYSVNENINTQQDATAAVYYKTSIDHPALEDLPPNLREYVNKDNVNYAEEIGLHNFDKSFCGPLKTLNYRNNFPDPDNDDGGYLL